MASLKYEGTQPEVKVKALITSSLVVWKTFLNSEVGKMKVMGHKSIILDFLACFFYFPGVQLHQSSNVEIKTFDTKAVITLRAAHKEDEGLYTARLRTTDGIQEHSAFVYLTGEIL